MGSQPQEIWRERKDARGESAWPMALEANTAAGTIGPVLNARDLGAVARRVPVIATGTVWPISQQGEDGPAKPPPGSPGGGYFPVLVQLRGTPGATDHSIGCLLRTGAPHIG